ncbi:hypothetical protein BMJ32_30060 [Sinorhizobium medicae]|nr:hypothetical protein BMJ32_30060 [Sinorhizobium medicae]PLU55086.1 hypothetical protein BMJ23_18390 [Sinorhizobium medicae]PLU65586.1 hypothetical protein BMJ21_20800 [Sinorhizobium medicae]
MVGGEQSAKPNWEAGPTPRFRAARPHETGQLWFAVAQAEPDVFGSEHQHEWKSRHEAQTRH